MTAVTAPGGTTVAPTVGPLRVLAWVEGGRLVRHPAFLAGLVLTAAVTLPSVGGQVNDAWMLLSGLLHVPIAGGTFLAANLNALRPRRHGTEELYRATPVPASTRTAAHLLAVAAGVAVAVGALVVVGTGLGAWGGVPVAFASGPRDIGLSAPQLAQGPAIVAVLGVSGVALARWVPSRAAGPMGVVALYFWIVATSWWIGGTVHWLGLFVEPYDQVGWIETADGSGYAVVGQVYHWQVAWHLAYLLGVTGVLGGVALLRHGLDRRGVGIIAGAGVAAAVSAVLQVP